MSRVRVAVGVGMIALVLGGCSGGGPPPTCEPSGTELRVAVPEGSSHVFGTDCLAAPAGEAFTITFDNNDSSPHGGHNVHIFEGGDDLFMGEVTGPETSIVYEVDPLPAGTYQFKCTPHSFMKGTFIVS